MGVPKKVYVYDPELGECVRVDDNPHTPRHAGPMVNDAYARKPLTSLGLSVHPGQAAAMRERVREAGASSGCHVNNQGEVTFTSRKARKRVLRHVGFVDRDGGYGD